MFWALVSQFGRYGLQAVAMLIIAFKVEVADFGYFILLFTIGTFVTSFVDFGTSTYLYFDPQPKKAFGTDLGLKLVLSIFCFLILFSFPFQYEKNPLNAEFYIFISSSVFLAFSNYFSVLKRLQKRHRSEAVSTTIYYVFLLSLLLLSEGGILQVSISFLIARAVFLLVNINNYGELEFSIRDLFVRLNTLKPYFFVLFSAVLLVNFDVFVISMFLGPEELGAYQIFFRVAMLASLLVEALNAVSYKKIAIYISTNQTTSHVSNIYLGASFLVLLMLTMLLNPLIEFVYHEKYKVSFFVVVCFSLVMSLRTYGGYLSALVVAVGKNYQRIAIMFFSFLVGLLINVAFLKRGGPNVAAFALLFSHVVLNAGYYFIWKRSKR